MTEAENGGAFPELFGLVREYAGRDIMPIRCRR